MGSRAAERPPDARSGHRPLIDASTRPRRLGRAKLCGREWESTTPTRTTPIRAGRWIDLIRDAADEAGWRHRFVEHDAHVRGTDRHRWRRRPGDRVNMACVSGSGVRSGARAGTGRDASPDVRRRALRRRLREGGNRLAPHLLGLSGVRDGAHYGRRATGTTSSAMPGCARRPPRGTKRRRAPRPARGRAGAWTTSGARRAPGP